MNSPEAFRTQLRSAQERGEIPTMALLEDLLVDSLYVAFDTPSGPAARVKEYLRHTGRACGIVGPEGKARRKRYQLMTARLNCWSVCIWQTGPVRSAGGAKRS